MRRVAAALCLMLAAAASAKPPAIIEPASPASVRVAAVAQDAGFQGQVLFAQRGRVELDQGFGHVSPVPEGVIVIDGEFVPGHRWRWASVTKQVASVIAMQEVAAGRLSLDAPVTLYLPEWRGATGGAVTVRNLLQHTSGLPDPNDDVKTYLPGEAVNADLASGFCAGPARDRPGASFRYNNCDFHVLGAILEKVTGATFARLVRDRIAGRIGAPGIALAPAGSRTVPGFIDDKPEMELDIAAFGAAGGLNGTARDLWRFDQALMDGRLLPAVARETMWKGDPKLGFAAFGQWVFPATLKGCAAPVRLVERRGAIGGIAVRNFIVPERNAVLIAFTNRGDGGFGEVWQGKGLSFDLLSAALCGGQA